MAEDKIIELCGSIFSRETDGYERLAAWDQLRPWLATKGYDLYLSHSYFSYWFPQHYVETDPDLFFAEMGGDPYPEVETSVEEEVDADFIVRKRRHLQISFYYRVGYAQDRSFRHVCLKLIELGSEEHKILTFLHSNKEEAMSNCVMPVLDFLDIGNYSFAIMPRWGTQPDQPWFSTVREAARFMQDILKAYSYLHRNYIVYQDIKLGNILLNHFATPHEYEFNEMRKASKRDHRIRYALCDFDSSFLLSPSPSGKPIRLPGELSFDIDQPKPHDTRQAEPDYDPFVFDIGCLGIVFWRTFFVNTKTFPLLIPLIDGMTTGKLEERLSAQDALRFVEDHILGGPSEVLRRPLEPPDLKKYISWDPDRHDKWADLSPEFVAKWERYRAPKSRLRDRVLRKICTNTYWGYLIIKFFRSLYRGYFR